MSTILVTGSTGTIGSQVVTALTGRDGVTVRAAVRPGKAKKSRAGNVQEVELDLEALDRNPAAFEGADKLFLVTPLSDRQVELAAGLVERAKKAGVRHVVKLSALGADVEPGIQLGRWHRAAERHIEASGLDWTFLRPNNFFENFLNYYGPDAQGNIYLPWGAAACSFISGGDIARVAAVALTGSGHAGKAYALTGPEAITIEMAAKAIGEVSGRAIRYVDVPEEAAKKAMLDMGMPAWAVDAMAELHALDKAGYAAGVTDTVERLTGRPAQRFVEFAKANRDRFRA